MTKRCVILTADQALRDLTQPARKDWDKRNRRKPKARAKSAAVVVDYVTLIPRYPTDPDDYTRCIGKWMACHTQATEMNTRRDLIEMLQQYLAAMPEYADYLTAEILRLQKEQAENVGVLSALIAAYEGCMTGFPV